MFESFVKEPAIEIIGSVADDELTIIESIGLSIYFIQQNAQFDLKAFSQSVFSQDIAMGKMLIKDKLRLIQLSPKNAYLFSEEPQESGIFSSMICDISHGYCHLKLSGSKQALEFINSYTPADLNNSNTAKSKTAKTLLGHFNVILWWDSHEKIKLVIDRSYAQSFADYLSSLFKTWQTI